MNIDYETIKSMAKARGKKVTDFLALAPQNDPFYVGTPGDCEQARWFAEIWQRTGYPTAHLRRIHYWTVSQDPPILMPNGLPYTNTDKCWEILNIASKKARYLDLVRVDQIVDNKHPAPTVNAWYYHNDPRVDIAIPDLSDPNVSIYGIDDSAAQPYHLEIWCEKSTMNDVLIPLARRYNANVATFVGETSLSACHKLIERIEDSGGKPTRIWYISDFDPAGDCMPVAMARKVEWLARRDAPQYDVKVRPALLTADQVAGYKLPRTPIKDTEKRAGKFEGTHGTGAVELDALEALYPGELAAILTGEIEPYYSQAARDTVRRNANALRQAVSIQIDAITGRYANEIAAIRQMFDEIKAIEIDAGQFTVDQFAPNVAEDDDWLFASGRDYIAQIERYKAHKDGRY